jgi:hypothetical protein
MITKRRTDRKKKPYGPNIVRAWFDTVFHFALRGLENERDFLVRRNWTFRFHNRALEYIGPLAEHLPTEARENLEQFLSFYPEVGDLIGEHDRRERRLRQDCAAYLQAILESHQFRQIFQSVEGEASETLGRDFSSYFGAYSSETDFMASLAEYLVNNVTTLPNHYSAADLWNHYGDRFREIVSAPELAVLADATAQSGQTLLEAVNDLTASFKSTRSSLSLEFDVPYVAELTSVR